MRSGSREPTVSTAHRQESRQTDRRWLLVWTSVLVAWLALSGIAVVLYRATGPHPMVKAAVRRVVHQVRWLIPFHKIPRNRRLSLQLDPAERGRRPVCEPAASAPNGEGCPAAPPWQIGQLPTWRSADSPLVPPGEERAHSLPG